MEIDLNYQITPTLNVGDGVVLDGELVIIVEDERTRSVRALDLSSSVPTVLERFEYKLNDDKGRSLYEYLKHYCTKAGFPIIQEIIPADHLKVIKEIPNNNK